MTTAFGLFFAFIGFQFVKAEWRNLHKTKDMQEWSHTVCTIEQVRSEDQGEDFRLSISYSYQVHGAKYNSTRYSPNGDLTRETIGEIKEAEKQFAKDRQLPCYYDPDAPGNAVLKVPSVRSAWTSLGFSMIFPVIGLTVAGFSWKPRRKQSARVETSDPRPARSPKIFLIIFGLIFATVGGAMLKPLLITPLQKTREAQNWNPIPATVVSSKVKSHSSDDGTTYSVYIAYRYEVDGEQYHGDRYTFMGGSSSGYDGKAEIIRQYPVGHGFKVYVNPDNASESVILRAYSKSLLFGLIPLVFFTIGMVIVIAGFRSRTPSLDMAQSMEHVVTLKAENPAKKAIGLSLFTAVWLMIVYFLTMSDAPLLFPIVFGAFGLALLYGSIHAVLATFNPRATAEITPGSIYPGTAVALRWRLSGRTDRIDSLSIALRCQKVRTETHRSGGKSETRVVKTTLFEEELLQTGNHPEIAQGTLQFRIPEDRPASRPGNTDGIQWQLLFHGVIVRWPDMKSEHAFTVYPHG